MPESRRRSRWNQERKWNVPFNFLNRIGNPDCRKLQHRGLAKVGSFAARRSRPLPGAGMELSENQGLAQGKNLLAQQMKLACGLHLLLTFVRGGAYERYHDGWTRQ